MRPQLLQTGAVPASTRRSATVALVLLAWALRVWTHFSAGRPVPEAPTSLRRYLLSADWPWVDPPLPGLLLAIGDVLRTDGLVLLGLELVATAIVVVLLLRLGERWLDFDAAVLGAGLWALCAPAVAVLRVPGSEGWEAAFSIMVASAMLKVARQRAPGMAWRVGASAGLLTLFSGGGILWALASMGWLPLTSNRFRGWGWLRTVGLVAAGWILVVAPVAVRNAAVTGDPKIPGTGDVARAHAAARVGEVAATPLDDFVTAPPEGPISVAYTDSVLAAEGVPLRTSEWSRATNLLTLTLQEAGEEGGRGFRATGRRVVAVVGGWRAPDTGEVIAVPWVLVVLLAWVGVVALLPATRQLFPLLVGGIVPLLQASIFGVDQGVVVAGAPFVCLYAGYGAWRIWTGRKWALTWAVAPAVLLLALLLHLLVRGWS